MWSYMVFTAYDISLLSVLHLWVWPCVFCSALTCAWILQLKERKGEKNTSFFLSPWAFRRSYTVFPALTLAVVWIWRRTVCRAGTRPHTRVAWTHTRHVPAHSGHASVYAPALQRHSEHWDLQGKILWKDIVLIVKAVTDIILRKLQTTYSISKTGIFYIDL